MTPKPNHEETVDPTLADLDAASRRRAGESRDEFPPTWNPAEGHPNPITTAAFPPLQKPANASSPLVELEHVDGKRYTLWLSDSLLKQLLRAGVREGMPVSIHRSDEKQMIEREIEGSVRKVGAWQWTITTPQNASLPVRGGQVLSIDDLRKNVVLPGERAQEIAPGAAAAGGELEPDEVEATVVPDDDDIPF